MKMLQLPVLLTILFLLLIQSACQLLKNGDTYLEEETNKIEQKFTRGGAPVEIVVNLSSNELKLTDYLTVQIETRFAEGVYVTPPYLSEAVYSPLLLIENPGEETFWSEQLGMMVNRWTYRFEPLTSGEFSLKAFLLNFRFEKEKTADPSQWPVYQIETEPIKYRVTSVDVNELDDIRDIKGLILPPFNYFPLILTLLLLSGIGLLAVLYFRLARNRSEQTSENVILKDYFREAVRKLEELEKRGLLNKSEFARFHTELSEILRNYLEHHFGLRTKEQTTEEFISEIFETRTFTEDQRGILDRFLQLADLVKFATFQPGSEISREALEKVKLFVQHTGMDHEV